MTRDTANARAIDSESRAAEFAYAAAVARLARNFGDVSRLERDAAFARRNARAFRALANGSPFPA